MNHAEIEEMLGVYALDAVERGEALVIEQHLADCPRCRGEVAAHREVAALLGNAGGEAPDGLWDRIAGELESEFRDAPPAPDLSLAGLGRGVSRAPVPIGSAPVRARRVRPVALSLGAIAAALALVVGLLSAKVGSLDGQVHNISSAVADSGAAQLSALALADPSHRSVQLDAATGRSGPRALLVMLPGGQSYWVTQAGLGKLASDKTYQLWALVGGRVVSIGLLGSSPRDVAVRTTSNMTRFMVTVEPLGGSTRPTSSIVVQGTPQPA